MIKEKFTQHREEVRARKVDAKLDYLTAPERDLSDLKTDDKEILGQQPGLLHGRLRSKTDQIMEKIEDAEADLGQKSTREKYHEYQNSRIDNKIARLERKLDNSSGSFFAKQIDRQREQTVKFLKNNKRSHNFVIGNIQKKRENKPEELQKEIDRIVDNRIEAMKRKAQRKKMREQNIGPLNFVSKEHFIASLNETEKRKIYREAILLTRKKNIEVGILDVGYQVDDSLETRKIGDYYERTIE